MRPGELIAGRFELERLAGRGGMGAVYRARDRERDDAPVAIKVLRPGQLGRPGRDERFLREMRALCELRHPAIVRYLAHGVTLAGDLYLAMEWIEGDTLRTRLRRQPLHAHECLHLAAQAASALGAAHRRGIVHRDVKPANLMLVGGDVGALKIVDFGLACIGPPEHQTERLTGQGAILGTPGYMAPEQARGAGAIGPPVDVFGLGCVLYECLTGRPPFAHDRVDQVLRDEAPPLTLLCPEAPAPFAALVTAMLAKEPAQRPADGTAVLEELTASCGSLLTALPAQAGATAERPRRPALTVREQRYMSVIAIRLDPGRTLDPAILATAASTLLQADVTWEDERPETSPLTDTERVSTPGDDDTLPPAATPDLLLGRQLQSLALALGARIEPLGEGIFVALLLGHGVATDQVARAARCALALGRAHPEAELALATGRSVMTGPHTQPDSRLPLGEVLDRALALLGLSAPRPPGPGSIRLDAIAAGLLGGGFEVEEDPAGTRLRGERKSDRARTLLGRHTQCVGRDRELRMLAGLYEECVTEPVARAVLLTAPAGTGKSRLRHELLRQLQSLAPAEGAPAGAPPTETRPLVLLARGDPMHSGSPLILLRQLLRQAAGLDDVPEADRHEHLARHLARRLAPADLERAAEFLGDLAGAPPPAPGALLTTARRDPTLLGEQQRRALLAWLRAETAARPVVLVLEDLHWGDLPSIKLVDAALSALADRPLYVLGIGRPEVHDLFPGLFSARAVQEIRLGPLTRKASESLVRQALGQGADRATIDTLVERAAGHAYALEELIRAVAEGRSGALPETLLAMTQARLDTLGSEERRLLRAASIFGERFTGQGLAALLGSEEHSAEVELRLADLVERELLACDLQGSARVCTFRHSLLREGAYATLTPEDRTLGHLLAAEWLERTRERDALLVAQHFELGGQPARAAPWHLQAAQQALAANDFRAAIERAERGVRSGASGETLGALHLVSGRSHMAFADVVQAEAACHQALELLPRGSHRWYQAASVAIASELLHGVVPVMILEMARFEPEGPITTDEGEMTAWSLLVLWALGLADPLQRFVARLERRAHLLAPGDPAAAWLDFARAIRAHMIDDDAPTALRHLAAACAAFERVEDLRSQALAQWVTSYVLYGLQDARACERVARQALATAERLGLHFIKGATRRNLGWALAARGDVAAGCAELRAALAADISPSNRWGSGGAHAQLAEALLHAGQLDEAEREAQQALELAMIPGSQVRAWLLLGEVQLRTGRPHEALATARKAETLLGQASVPGYLLWSGDHLLARALAATGDPEGAALALARVHERLRAQAARFQDPAARRRFLLHHRAVLEQTDLPTAPRQGAPSH